MFTAKQLRIQRIEAQERWVMDWLRANEFYHIYTLEFHKNFAKQFNYTLVTGSAGTVRCEHACKRIRDMWRKGMITRRKLVLPQRKKRVAEGWRGKRVYRIHVYRLHKRDR